MEVFILDDLVSLSCRFDSNAKSNIHPLLNSNSCHSAPGTHRLFCLSSKRSDPLQLGQNLIMRRFQWHWGKSQKNDTHSCKGDCHNHRWRRRGGRDKSLASPAAESVIIVVNFWSTKENHQKRKRDKNFSKPPITEAAVIHTAFKGLGWKCQEMRSIFVFTELLVL